ncbi:hypothetical protein BC940DRAFT_287990 [Gongronella butleri]|nr:hypothetical protein BC940DRAFT_287990 [Gongronella butleri]
MDVESSDAGPGIEAHDLFFLGVPFFFSNGWAFYDVHSSFMAKRRSLGMFFLANDGNRVDSAPASSLFPRRRSLLVGQDTLASLYKRYTTLALLVQDTHDQLVQQQQERDHYEAWAQRLDLANSRMQRKLALLSPSPPNSPEHPSFSHPQQPPPPAKDIGKLQREADALAQQLAALHSERHAYEARIEQLRSKATRAHEKAQCCQQQVRCLQQYQQQQQPHDKSRDKLYLQRALLEQLQKTKQYMDHRLLDFYHQWAPILHEKNNDNDTTTPLHPFKIPADALANVIQTHLHHEKDIKGQLDAIHAKQVTMVLERDL